MIDFNKYFIVGTNSNALHDTMNGLVVGELIRCRDCKHRPYKDERGHVVPPEEDEELSLCPCVDDGDWYYNYIPNDDWYCANGEPKEKE